MNILLDPNAAPTGGAPTPAPTPAPAQVPAVPQVPQAQADPELSYSHEITFVDSAGQTRRATLGDLIGAHERVASLGNIEDAADVVAAMNNDPAATERLLTKQLEQLRAKKAPTSAEAGEISRLNATIQALQKRVDRFDRVAGAVEDVEFSNNVKTMLADPRVKATYKHITHNAGGAQVAERHMRELKRRADAAGVNLGQRSDLIINALAAAEAEVSALATAYGWKIPDPQVSTNGKRMVQTPQSPESNVVAGARVTMNDLLQARAGGGGAVHQAPYMVPGGVPEPGGVVGAVPGGFINPPQTGPTDRAGYLQRLRNRQNQGQQ